MRIISRKKIEAAKGKYPNASKALDTWFDIVSHAVWNSPADVKRMFSSASILGDNRIIFNIKGNNYRLMTGVNYPSGIVFIKWFGTHAEYDKKKF